MKNYWQLLAFVMVTAVFAYGLHWDQKRSERQIVRSQLNGCIRGHRLRDQLNTDTRIIKYFMDEIAAAVQRHPGERAKIQGELYRGFSRGLILVGQPNCQKVIYRP